MKFVPNVNIATESCDIDLSSFYKQDLTFTINIPIVFPYIVLDSSNTLIGFEYEPLLNSKYYHPQPGTNFVVLGQLYDNEGKELPLLPNSYLLSFVTS